MLPVPFIPGAVGVFVYALSAELMLSEITFVVVSVGIEKLSLAVPKAVLPLAFIDGAVRIYPLAATVEQLIRYVAQTP